MQKTDRLNNNGAGMSDKLKEYWLSQVRLPDHPVSTVKKKQNTSNNAVIVELIRSLRKAYKVQFYWKQNSHHFWSRFVSIVSSTDGGSTVRMEGYATNTPDAIVSELKL